MKLSIKQVIKRAVQVCPYGKIHCMYRQYGTDLCLCKVCKL